MAYSQSKLGRRFFRGATSGKASNVKTETFADLGLTALIGYGHAVYATRDMDTGHVTAYMGWDGYSNSTSCQLSKLGLRHGVEETVDEQKKRGTLRGVAL